MMDAETRIRAFKRAYSAPGGLHWHYTRGEAAAVWIRHGFYRLMSAPPGAADMLAEWIAECPQDAMRRARLDRAADAAIAGRDYSADVWSRDDWQELEIILADRGFYDLQARA